VCELSKKQHAFEIVCEAQIPQSADHCHTDEKSVLFLDSIVVINNVMEAIL
jgi:hypothetical protein